MQSTVPTRGSGRGKGCMDGTRRSTSHCVTLLAPKCIGGVEEGEGAEAEVDMGAEVEAEVQAGAVLESSCCVSMASGHAPSLPPLCPLTKQVPSGCSSCMQHDAVAGAIKL